MVIEVAKLQTVFKVFLQDTNTIYSETLELIHAEFRVQTTREHLLDTMMRSRSTAIARRNKMDDNVNLKKIDVPINTTESFPSNHGKLLP